MRIKIGIILEWGEEKVVVSLFYAYDLYLAKDFPVLDFGTGSYFGFKVFFVWKRRVDVFEGFKVHDLDACWVNREYLAGTFVDNGDFCAAIYLLNELPFLVIEDAYGDYSCFCGPVFAGFGFGYVHNLAGFAIYHHVAADA